MRPTKVKELIPEVANTLQLPADHLSAMYSFYIRENKKILSGMEKLHVTLRGLGRMTIKGWEIQRRLDYMRNKVRICRAEESIKHYQDKIKVFEKVLPLWEEQEKRKMVAKKLKQEYYKNKENDSERKNTSSLE